jgi:hypothetical protein
MSPRGGSAPPEGDRRQVRLRSWVGLLIGFMVWNVVVELEQQESISLARLRELVSAAPRGAVGRDVVVSGAPQNTPAGDLVGERRTD